ncbi:MAG TPA: FHA domain-containing protein [Firmicutes bacterium]|nr:FHA domain-containing protein [Bacillota bacterium]
MAILLFQEGINAGKVLELEQNDYTMGRHNTNDIMIPDPLASRYHSKLVKKEDDYYYIDFDSHNGSWVNGLRVKIKKLSMKDTIRIGKSLMILLNSVPDILEEQEALDNLTQDKVKTEIPDVFKFKELPQFERLNPSVYIEVEGNYYTLLLMNRINTTFALTKDLKDVFRRLARFFCDVSNADRVYFVGYNGMKDFFSPIAGVKRDGAKFEDIQRISFLEDFYRRLIQSKLSVWLKNTDLSKSFKESNDLFIVPICSCMCFPMVYKEKILGIMQFDYLDKVDVLPNLIYLINRITPLIAYNVLSRS